MLGLGLLDSNWLHRKNDEKTVKIRPFGRIWGFLTCFPKFLGPFALFSISIIWLTLWDLFGHFEIINLCFMIKNMLVPPRIGQFSNPWPLYFKDKMFRNEEYLVSKQNLYSMGVNINLQISLSYIIDNVYTFKITQQT